MKAKKRSVRTAVQILATVFGVQAVLSQSVPPEEIKPAGVVKPVEVLKSAEISKPAEMIKPAGVVKPVEVLKSAEISKPAEMIKPAEIIKAARVTSLKTSNLKAYDAEPEAVRALIAKALELTTLNLTYTFASADPKNEGMDCSGTIYFLLRSQGLTKVPRQSDHIAQWVIDEGKWTRTEGVVSLDDPVFDALKPGDLLFWSGTYEHGTRKLPVSHVMLFLGRHHDTGKPVIFGASDGRTYAGQPQRGISVFDFALPKATSASAFYGYGTPPGLRKVEKDE